MASFSSPVLAGPCAACGGTASVRARRHADLNWYSSPSRRQLRAAGPIAGRVRRRVHHQLHSSLVRRRQREQLVRALGQGRLAGHPRLDVTWRPSSPRPLDRNWTGERAASQQDAVNATWTPATWKGHCCRPVNSNNQLSGTARTWSNPPTTWRYDQPAGPWPARQPHYIEIQCPLRVLPRLINARPFAAARSSRRRPALPWSRGRAGHLDHRRWPAPGGDPSLACRWRTERLASRPAGRLRDNYPFVTVSADHAPEIATMAWSIPEVTATSLAAAGRGHRPGRQRLQSAQQRAFTPSCASQPRKPAPQRAQVRLPPTLPSCTRTLTDQVLLPVRRRVLLPARPLRPSNTPAYESSPPLSTTCTRRPRRPPSSSCAAAADAIDQGAGPLPPFRPTVVAPAPPAARPPAPGGHPL